MLCQACVCMGINVKLLLNIIMLDKFVCGLSKKHTVRAINFMLLWCFIIGIVTYPDIPITIELLLCGLLLLYIAATVLYLKINCKSIKKACLKQTDKSKNMIIKDISIDIIREALFWGTLFLLPWLGASIKNILADVGMVVIVLCGLLYYVYIIGAAAREREQAELVIENLREIMRTNNEQNQKVVAGLFRQRFEAVDKFAAMRYECSDDRQLNVNYGKEAVRLVRNMALDSAELTKLKGEIDSSRNNLMSRLEQAYPQLSIQERTMYMYAVIGLSPRAMSVLLGMNIENVYNRKSRLKAKLRAGSAEFVDALNA